MYCPHTLNQKKPEHMKLLIIKLATKRLKENEESGTLSVTCRASLRSSPSLKPQALQKFWLDIFFLVVSHVDSNTQYKHHT